MNRFIVAFTYTNRDSTAKSSAFAIVTISEGQQEARSRESL
jgi:hypothetical protein